MITKYNTELDSEAVVENLSRIGNQIFKLLPTREENKEWHKPLDTVSLEVLGLSGLFNDEKDLVSLASKLESLKMTGDFLDFSVYRRVILECCSLVDRLKKQCR